MNAHCGLTKQQSAKIAPHRVGSMNAVLLGFPFLFRRLLKAENKYYVAGMALLNTLYLFLIFDNMLFYCHGWKNAIFCRSVAELIRSNFH